MKLIPADMLLAVRTCIQTASHPNAPFGAILELLRGLEQLEDAPEPNAKPAIEAVAD